MKEISGAAHLEAARRKPNLEVIRGFLMEVAVPIENLPPKKDGANSMWRKGSELSRLKDLRLGVLKALGGKPGLLEKVELEIRIFADPRAGDLDNFITGICDRLMAAHPATPIDDQAWIDLPEAARPRNPIAFLGDASIMRIVAERFDPPERRFYYELIIRGNHSG